MLIYEIVLKIEKSKGIGGIRSITLTKPWEQINLFVIHCFKQKADHPNAAWIIWCSCWNVIFPGILSLLQITGSLLMDTLFDTPFVHHLFFNNNYFPNIYSYLLTEPYIPSLISKCYFSFHMAQVDDRIFNSSIFIFPYCHLRFAFGNIFTFKLYHNKYAPINILPSNSCIIFNAWIASLEIYSYSNLYSTSISSFICSKLPSSIFSCWYYKHHGTAHFIFHTWNIHHVLRRLWLHNLIYYKPI